MSVTQEIKDRLDIVDFVSGYLPLRKSGRNYAGFCPFHQNTRTPSFYVFPETQTWRCFGACAEGGDIFSFVMKKEGWDFKEALQNLAQRAGVTLDTGQGVDKAKQAAAQKLADLLGAAADYFHMLLLHAPEATYARQYVGERALAEETLDTFRVGFALPSWDACRNHFNDQGYDDADLIAVGLLTVNEEKQRRYDRFRNRLMIPIRDVNGRVVGFGARTLDKDGLPKYLNSPQTALFDKSSLLYGLDTAKRHIREARQVVIVEGYMDVMQGWQHGYRNLVAQMGTALTEPQLQALKRYTKRFVLALDADAAGAKATLRGLQVARQSLDHELEARFDAPNLVRYESRLQADIHVVTLPEGNDPDKLIRTNPAQWPELLAQSQPVVAYVIEVLTRGLDMGDAKAKTAVAQQVIPLIKDIQDPVERDHYWQQLGHALQIDERALRQVRLDTKPPAPRPSAPSTSSFMPPEPDTPWPEGTQIKPVIVRPSTKPSREENFLYQCLVDPQLGVRVNQLLQQMGQTAVSANDFPTIEDKLLWQSLTAGLVVADRDLCDSLDDPVLLRRVEALKKASSHSQANLARLPDTPDKLALSVLQWRLEAIKRQSQEIKQLVHSAAQQAEPELLRLHQQQANTLTAAKRDIDKAIASMSALNRRRTEERDH
ncbi:MAG: DNA primase [Anaerolinea sp.]|nr:DNA primase [Anaerolinea sp.]